MAAIEEDLMQPLRDAFDSQGFSSMTGLYDGEKGSITMLFTGDPVEYTVEFEYLGSVVEEFRDLLFRVSGEVVKKYHAAHQPDRTDFINAVTEP